MRDKDIYEYAIIRLVPKVERGEYINIGVILLAKHKDYLDMKYLIETDKIAAISSEVDVDLIKKYLEAWKAVCQGGNAGGKIGEQDIRFRFRWLTASRSTIIQSSPVHPGRGDNPAAVLDGLLKRYVL